MGIATKLEDMGGKVGEKVCSRIWGRNSMTAEFSVLLHDNGAWSGCVKGCRAWAVGGDDSNSAVVGEAEDLRSPATEGVPGVGENSAAMAAMSYLENSTLLFVIQAGEMGIMRAGGMDKPAVGPERLGSALKLLILIRVVGKIGLREANDVGVEECQRIEDDSFFDLSVEICH